MDDHTTSASNLDGASDHGSFSDATATGAGGNTSEPARSKHLSTGRLVIYAAVIALVGALALTTLFSSNVDAPESGPSQADGLNQFQNLAFVTTDGTTSNLADYEGQPLVVNFFASWCAPCRAEMPHFESASIANGDDVKFLGVNHDLEDSSWKAFVAETEVTFETVFQPGTEIWNEIDAKGMPTTAFVSADGDLLHVYTGVLDEATLQSLIDEHLLETA